MIAGYYEAALAATSNRNDRPLYDHPILTSSTSLGMPKHELDTHEFIFTHTKRPAITAGDNRLHSQEIITDP